MSDERDETFHGRFDADTSPSMALLHTIAVADNTPIESLPPLHNQVEVEALDMLVIRSAEDAGVEVGFSYQGYQVRVRGDGSITVRRESSTAADS